MNIFEVIVASNCISKKGSAITAEDSRIAGECLKFTQEMKEFYRLKQLSDISHRNFVEVTGIKDPEGIVKYIGEHQELRERAVRDNFYYIEFLEKPLSHEIPGLRDYLVKNGKGGIYETLKK